MARLQAKLVSAEAIVRQSIDSRQAAIDAARFHRARVAEAKEHNRRVLGVLDIREKTYVDGKLGVPLASVNLDGGQILTIFPFPVLEILQYIDYLLVTRSPVGGAPEPTYQRSHRLFADGVETDPENPNLDAREWVFTSNLPYARKIERGQGSAPKEGVYQGAVALALKKYGNVATIRFSFEAIVEGGIQDYAAAARSGTQRRHVQTRYPAIRIRLR